MSHFAVTAWNEQDYADRQDNIQGVFNKLEDAIEFVKRKPYVRFWDTKTADWYPYEDDINAD